LARRSLSSSLDAIVRAVSARWPTILQEHLGGYDVRACFDRLLSHRERLWAGFALHLCCWFLGAAEVWVAFRLLGVEHVIPMHYATFPMLTGTPEGLRAEAKDIAGLEIHALKPGESLG